MTSLDANILLSCFSRAAPPSTRKSRYDTPGFPGQEVREDDLRRRAFGIYGRDDQPTSTLKRKSLGRMVVFRVIVAATSS